MGLPLQPSPPRSHLLTAVLPVAVAILGLAALGAFGLIRRPPMEVVVTGPGHIADYPRLAERLIAGAQQRIRVQQYVVRLDGDGPVAGLLAALVAAQARGVDVRVALDRGKLYQSDAPDPKNDEAAAWLTAHGIAVVWDEVSRTSHAKVLLVDDRQALIGSHNWTRAALFDNREASVLLSDPTAVAPIRDLLATIPGLD